MIDLTGTGKTDLCAKNFNIPVKIEEWSEWLGNDLTKIFQ